MALTLSPYATGFPSDSLNAVPVHRTNHMSRAVSINMEGVGNDHQAGDGSNQYVEGLDMDMVATFGDHMDMNFAAGPSDKGVSMVGEYRVGDTTNLASTVLTHCPLSLRPRPPTKVRSRNAPSPSF